jgi:GH15 family glucan-1,4-alpha-glucosidase
LPQNEHTIERMARIEDYGLIGDLQTAALVGRDGSIDWVCFPRFDSGACFAALLGTPEHGRWSVAPRTDAWEAGRRYRPQTLVLETDWETDTGAVRVIDFMPPRGKRPTSSASSKGSAARWRWPRSS